MGCKHLSRKNTVLQRKLGRKPNAGCRWESKQSCLISKADPLQPSLGAEGDTEGEEKGAIERLSWLQPASFVMSSCGLLRPATTPGRSWPDYTAAALVHSPGRCTAVHGCGCCSEPSGCTAEHRNINTAQTQSGPLGASSKTNRTRAAPLLAKARRDPQAAREIRAAANTNCSFHSVLGKVVAVVLVS